MRNAVIAFILLMIAVLTVVTINTIDTTTTRQNELDSNLSAAMEQSMMLLLVDPDSASYSIETNEELVADCIQNFLVKTTTDSTFTIEIMEVDVEKGFLDVKVTETFATYAGMTKSVDTRKQILVEDYVNQDNVYYTINFIVPDPNYPDDASKQTVVKQISVHGGSTLEHALPATPVVEGHTFKGWRCSDISNIALFTDLNGLAALGDYTFTAVFE